MHKEYRCLDCNKKSSNPTYLRLHLTACGWRSISQLPRCRVRFRLDTSVRPAFCRACARLRASISTCPKRRGIQGAPTCLLMCAHKRSFRELRRRAGANSGNPGVGPGATSLVLCRGACFGVRPCRLRAVNAPPLLARVFRAGRGRGEWGQVVFGRAVR
jgi:hypothetical protein